MNKELYIDIYKKFCKLAATDESIFKVFKSHPEYVPMLEHLDEKQGLEYLMVIKEKYSQLFDKLNQFRGNDAVGSPNRYEYGETGLISPTTLRYVKMLGDMIEMYETFENETIIELGGGYGGQCKIISD